MARKRAQARTGGAAGRYRVPAGTVYNEFVGVLGPIRGPAEAELHVRVGEHAGRCVDWSIDLIARSGHQEDFLRVKRPLERRTRQRVSVSGSTIRQETFDQLDPRRSVPRIVTKLRAGDTELVDQEYARHIASLYRTWTSGNGVDPHTEVMFQFAMTLRDDPQFGAEGEYSWVRDTVVALDPDRFQDVIAERAAHYFAGRPCTAGVCNPASERMKFLRIGVPSSSPDIPADALDDDQAFHGNPTMGMLADYLNAGRDWVDRLTG
ncbi:hypothetical protein [Nocardia sp. alder85J]|uniref:hypothetical protein n=1 Tax=Nocardia sp. alder85J TaxID=2862949 RepID=UPI001CD3DAC5|nr:hypothetical protein [Nocardia sp. alder85J]MCX4094551.1 hypothetical protein [Nocardia sp. alder85J]